MDRYLEIITCILSLIAIIVSVLTYGNQKNEARKLNEINLESQIYMEVFKDYMLVKLPMARNKAIISKDGFLIDYNELASCLVNLTKSSLYFKYRNNRFYKVLKDKAQALEDILITSEGKKFSNEDSKNLIIKIDQHMDDLYSIIIKNFFGNK